MQIRTQGSYVRKCLSTRDGGRCAECGVDAAGLYKRARAAWVSGVPLAAKREAVAREMAGTPFEGKVDTAMESVYCACSSSVHHRDNSGRKSKGGCGWLSLEYDTVVLCSVSVVAHEAQA